MTAYGQVELAKIERSVDASFVKIAYGSQQQGAAKIRQERWSGRVSA